MSAIPDRSTEAALPARGQALALLASRFLLSPLFLYSGTGKILNFGATAARLPGGAEGFGTLLALGAIAVELGCAVALVLGLFTRWAALALILFTAAATLMFHNFWAVPEAAVQAQTVQFLKNLGLIGGLALLAGFGAGAHSLDARRA